MKVKSESEVAQSCPTLCDPMDCSPPGSSVPGILQARALEWAAIAFSTLEMGPIVKAIPCFPIFYPPGDFGLSEHLVVIAPQVKGLCLVVFLLPIPLEPLQNLLLKILVCFQLKGPSSQLSFQESPTMNPDKQSKYYC